MDSALQPDISRIRAGLRRIVREVIGDDDGDLDGDAPLLSYVTSSLALLQVIRRVHDRFSVLIPIRSLLEGAATMHSVAVLIEQALHAREANAQLQAVKQEGIKNPHDGGESSHDDQGSDRRMRDRDPEWGKQRMTFLRREGELPSSIAPARGLMFQPTPSIRSILLTGATGFLGVYILEEALRTTNVDLHCLIRERHGVSPKTRIEEQLREYALWKEDEGWKAAWESRVHLVSGDIILPRLGIADHTYEHLARNVDAIIHTAAHANFIYPYEALKATNVLGLHEIIRFAFHGRIKPVHCLSTAAVWPFGARRTFFEGDSLDHGKLLNLGYHEAKWVGEKCLVNAMERGLPVARYRPGEVGGDSENGHWVLNHFFLAALKGFLQFGAFPEVDTRIDVVPVDYVAKVLVHLAVRRSPLGRAFHLTNPNTWHVEESLSLLRDWGYRFEVMPFQTLRSRLFASADFAENALFPYLTALESMNDESLEFPQFDCRGTLKELEGSGIICPPADATLFTKYLRYLQGVRFLPDPNDQQGLRRRQVCEAIPIPAPPSVCR
jgi:myxalamid-type nonribosomal peptide synthetase MxaA